MKITAAHYNELKGLISVTGPVRNYSMSKLVETYKSDYDKGAIKAKDIDKRLRWDLFACVPADTRKELIDELYTYMNDDHLDTALKNVVKDILKEESELTLINVKFKMDDPGNCRVYYMSEAKRLYCLMDEEWYYCSRDGEPESTIDTKRFKIVIV